MLFAVLQIDLCDFPAEIALASFDRFDYHEENISEGVFDGFLQIR
jgi:hypothetical protein